SVIPVSFLTRIYVSIDNSTNTRRRTLTAFACWLRLSFFSSTAMSFRRGSVIFNAQFGGINLSRTELVVPRDAALAADLGAAEADVLLGGGTATFVGRLLAYAIRCA